MKLSAAFITTGTIFGLASAVAIAVPMADPIPAASPSVPSALSAEGSQLERRQITESFLIEACIFKNRVECERFLHTGVQGRGDCLNRLNNNLHDRITSIYLQSSDICEFFVDINCSGGSFTIDGGRVDDLSVSFNGAFDNKISALRCWRR